MSHEVFGHTYFPPPQQIFDPVCVWAMHTYVDACSHVCGENMCAYVKGQRLALGVFFHYLEPGSFP